MSQSILIIAIFHPIFRSSFCFAINWLIIHKESFLPCWQRFRHPPSQLCELSFLTQEDLPFPNPLLLTSDHTSQIAKVTLNLDASFQGPLQAWGEFISSPSFWIFMKVIENKGRWVAPKELAQHETDVLTTTLQTDSTFNLFMLVFSISSDFSHYMNLYPRWNPMRMYSLQNTYVYVSLWEYIVN